MLKRAAVLDLLCANRRQMRFALGVLIAMGLLSALSLLFVGPGDRSYPILVLDIVIVVTGIAFFGGAHWYCTKRAMES